MATTPLDTTTLIAVAAAATTTSTAPVITDVVDDTGAQAFALYLGERTYDTTPTARGTGDPGMTLLIYDNGVEVGSTVVGTDGQWSWTPSAPLTPGNHNFTPVGQLPDGSGTTGASNIVYFTVLAPDVPQPVITQVLDDQGSTVGAVPGEYFQTDDTTPTLVGTAQPGVTLTFAVVAPDYTTQTLGQQVVDASGKWSFTTPDLTLGLNELLVTASNADGSGANQGPVTFNYQLVTQVAAPTLTGALDDIGPVSSTLHSGASTDDARPTFQGTATPGSVLDLYDNGEHLGTVARVGDDGQWAFTPTTALAEGQHNITLVSAPGLGQGLAAGQDTLSFTVEPGASAARGSSAVLDPVLTEVLDSQGINQGNMLDVGHLDDARPVFSGTAEPGTLVNIYDGYLIGQAVADANWHWSFQPISNLAEGGHDITLTSSRAAGWDETPSVYTYHYEVTSPDVPSVLPPVITQLADDSSGTAQPVLSGGIGQDATPTLSGTGEPGSVVQLSDNGVVVATVDVGADWLWSWTPTTDISAGQHVFSAIGQYADGSGKTAAWYTQDYTLEPVVTAATSLDVLLTNAGLTASAPAPAPAAAAPVDTVAVVTPTTPVVDPLLLV